VGTFERSKQVDLPNDSAMCTIDKLPGASRNTLPPGSITIHADVARLYTPPRSSGETERTLALAEMNEQLRRTVALKDRILALVAHELRTPLTPILMLSEVLMSLDSSDALVREMAETVHVNAMLATRLIADLLDISRGNTGKLQLSLGRCDVHEIIRHAEATIDFDARERMIALKLELGATMHIVNGDVDRLAQALLNLLGNAIKFSAHGGTVTVRTSDRAGDRIAIEVIDEGMGIDGERLVHLFEAFYQAPEERSARQHGLGLGLAISRMLVEAHGGSLRARSDGPGTGATFEILIPVDTCASPAD
jgi:signal transduction histidine kinase